MEVWEDWSNHCSVIAFEMLIEGYKVSNSILTFPLLLSLRIEILIHVRNLTHILLTSSAHLI
jgi:hypothetical protein